jgi:hypothetical protein
MPGVGQGPAGDLYLEVAFRPHPRYRVEQRDVYLDVPWRPGRPPSAPRVEVPTPDGAVEVKIPAGAAAGRKLRLKGRGIPGSTPGDFYVVLQIALPPADTDAARAFYAGMAEQFKSFDPDPAPEPENDGPPMLPQASATILEEQTGLSLSELSRACAVQCRNDRRTGGGRRAGAGGAGPPPLALHRRTCAPRQRWPCALQRDLGLNLAGAALALELMDELEAARELLRALGAR